MTLTENIIEKEIEKEIVMRELKTLCNSVLILILVSMASLAYGGPYSGGSGDANDPFQVATAQDLIALGETSEDYDKHFILTTDIDLSGYTFDRAVIAPDAGSEWYFEGARFTGVFNGNGHAIANLTISGGDYCGLFGCVTYPGKVTSLALVGVNVTGYSNIGCLVGYLSYKNDPHYDFPGIISHCTSSGIITSTSYVGSGTGGLVGYNGFGLVENSGSIVRVYGRKDSVGGIVGINYGTIWRCYHIGSVEGSEFVGGIAGSGNKVISQCHSGGEVVGSKSVGGICGLFEANGSTRGRMHDCYSTCFVSGSNKVGGLIGRVRDVDINTSYSIGLVRAGSNGGGLIGYADSYSSPNILNCFWDTQTSGKNTSAGGTGLNTTDMRDISTYLNAGWGFVGETANGDGEIWLMEPLRYPVLNHVDPPEMPMEGVLSISVENTSVIESVGDVPATITRSGDLAKDLTVTVSSSDPSILRPPQRVTIKKGDTSVQTSISIANDGSIGDKSALITASSVFYSPALLTIAVLDDDTEDYRTLGGHLAGKITEGTYTVLRHIKVFDELIVDPNVTMKFLPEVGLFVYGSLSAQGEDSMPIVLTSSLEEPQPGDWSGIRAYAGIIEVNNIDLSYASIGLYIKETQNLSIRDSIIINSRIHKCRDGILISDSSRQETVRIINNTITENNQTGIYIGCDSTRGAGALISNNEISRNMAGIHLRANRSLGNYICVAFCPGAITDCSISNNLILSNGSGIIGHTGSYGVIGGSVRNNIIINNTADGCWFSANGEIGINIENNTIAFNADAGVELSSGTYLGGFTVKNNIILSNRFGLKAMWLISSGSSVSNSASYNNVFDNTVDWHNYPPEYGDLTTATNNGLPADIGFNISVDPEFAALPVWDQNGTPEDASDDFLLEEGDYHLKSSVGRWNAAAIEWVVDDISSPCIDAGDPNTLVGFEPDPNGFRINMGAYGGTDEASMSDGQ